MLLSHHGPEFEAAMAALEIGRNRYRNALREQAVVTMNDVAVGTLSEDELAAWIRAYTDRLS